MNDVHVLATDRRNKTLDKVDLCFDPASHILKCLTTGCNSQNVYCYKERGMDMHEFLCERVDAALAHYGGLRRYESTHSHDALVQLFGRLDAHI